MKLSKTVLIFLLFLPSLHVYCDGFDFEYDGEVRTRFAYENNLILIMTPMTEG